MRIKVDKNDTLFSKLKRAKFPACQKCGKRENLQAAHIFSRGHYNTRFDEDNCIVLCFTCHQWFDTHKIFACVFDEGKRCFEHDEESFHFLVKKCGYTWEKILQIYRLSQEPFRGYKQKKDIIYEKLKYDYENHCQFKTLTSPQNTATGSGSFNIAQL